jgi:hypothetical protein
LISSDIESWNTDLIKLDDVLVIYANNGSGLQVYDEPIAVGRIITSKIPE